MGSPLTSEDDKLIASFVEWLKNNTSADEQIDLIIATARWIGTARRSGGFKGDGPSQADLDQEHLPFPTGPVWFKSALLHRLRSGKDPLPIPPPTSFRQPWYAIMEDGGEHPCVVGTPVPVTSLLEVSPEDKRLRLVINEAVWLVEKKVSETEYLVRWREGYPLFRLRKHPDPKKTFDWLIRKVEE
jgi:hypothetical protein